jgi:tetratricopeptide (TPR) repeat protein
MDTTATPDKDVLPAIGSTDPQHFLDMRAQQRAQQLRRTRRKRWGVAVAAAALLTGTAALRVATSTASAVPAPAAVPSVVQVPTETATLASTAELPAPAVVAPVMVPAAASPEEQARCTTAYREKHWRVAVEACSLVFATAPDHQTALHLAHAQWARGQREQAGEWAAKALELGSQDADAFVLLGHAQRRAGRHEEAIRSYRSYLERAPRGWHAGTVRQALRALEPPR